MVSLNELEVMNSFADGDDSGGQRLQVLVSCAFVILDAVMEPQLGDFLAAVDAGT